MSKAKIRVLLIEPMEYPKQAFLCGGWLVLRLPTETVGCRIFTDSASVTHYGGFLGKI